MSPLTQTFARTKINHTEVCKQLFSIAYGIKFIKKYGGTQLEIDSFNWNLSVCPDFVIRLIIHHDFFSTRRVLLII